MAWDIAVAGTVCLDDVTTPRGHVTDQQGGSAVYTSLAASTRARVHLNGVVGADGLASVRAAFDGTGVDLAGLTVVAAPTRRWRAVHDFDRWVASSETSEEGAAATWEARLTPASAAAPVLFLGSMDPRHQIAILEQSRAGLVGADSMTAHMGDPDGRAAVRRVVEASDVLFLNAGELAALLGAPDTAWLGSARSLVGRGRLRAVVVKHGPLGAALVTATRVVEREADPVDPVVDPTGAGDSLAGGFLGACAAAERADEDFFATALEAGMGAAAASIGAFGIAGLRALALAYSDPSRVPPTR